jgi:hypothetical protein
MTSKESLTIGLVGSRAFELQAWQSPGSSAVEEAYWASSDVPERMLPQRSRLMRLIDGISAAAVIAATRK